MNRLDKTIADVAFILDNLILLRQIQSTGDCNICVNKDCGYIPKTGQMVRYNCPFYKTESEVKEYETKIITHGNCMICGKELTEGLFLCKECGEKANKEREEGE